MGGAFAAATPLVRSPQADKRPLEIGRHAPGAMEYLNGRLDELRIYDRALSAPEVLELYRLDPDNPPPSCADTAEASTVEFRSVKGPRELLAHAICLLLLFAGALFVRSLRRRSQGPAPPFTPARGIPSYSGSLGSKAL